MLMVSFCLPNKNQIRISPEEMVQMFLLPILLVIPIVWIIASNNKRHQASYNGRQAIDIAKERYARGEITKDQYDQMKKDLS